MKVRIILLLFICSAGILSGQVATDNIPKQIQLFPQEKIYLQTDKSYYIPGEKVFFRIFLVDALSSTVRD